MKTFYLTACLLFAAITLHAQVTPLWLRYPAISPDGKQIAFGYKGDIYLVSSSGGQAVPLTLNEAHDMMPVWSNDSKSIAFSSNRNGNFDVFLVPTAGGPPVQLTQNSANDYPYDFSPDNKNVLFGSSRNGTAESARFHSPRIFQNLYQVNVTGGKPVLVSAAGIENARYSKDGNLLVFEDKKGYEDSWRKHHTSSVTRDIWIFDIKAKTYRQVSTFEGEDRNPIFSEDGKNIYFLSEKNGNQNLFQMPVAGQANYLQLTNFQHDPVRHLTAANDQTLCFSQNGEIYTLKDGQPKKLNVRISNDGGVHQTRIEPVTGNVSEFSLSPNGKEIAFINRGEVFVTSVENGQIKQITNTPQQERMVTWSPDGKSLYYSSERDSSWDIYRSIIVQKDEPYFFAATVIRDEPIIHGVAEQYQPEVSPDGKEIAYVEDRNTLCIFNLKTKTSRTVLPKGHNHSYSDGDWTFNWSPDGKYILTDDQKGSLIRANLAIIKADGTGEAIYPVNSGFGEVSGKWALNGKMITWASGLYGKKSLANQGNSESDIFGVFLDQEAYDRASMTKADFDLLTEREERERSASKDSLKAPKKSVKQDTSKKGFVPDFSNLENRRVRLTINSSALGGYTLNADATKLYYLASFESGYDIWVTNTRSKETKILAKLSGSPSGVEMSKDGKFLFVINKGNLVKVESENGKISPIGISADMTIDAAAEREYIFNHAWRQVKAKFYDPKLHGVNWTMYKETYERFLPHVNNNFDFQELLSEILGELNASHTGGRYSPSIKNAVETARLGLLFDETRPGNGLEVTEIIAGGPLSTNKNKVKPGHILTAIDNELITSEIDWAKYLNNKKGKNTLLSFYDATSKTKWTETIRPIGVSDENNLMYNRWVKKMELMVEKLSGGKVGYVHVESMNDASFRETFNVVMGKNLDKEALIVDTRFNGGGWLHDDLNTFLSGKKYLEFSAQGDRLKGGEPISRWYKPSCVVMNEANYSDAFIFPYIYKHNGGGKLIGMPVAGTGTAVWWERQMDPTLIFGIPMIGTIGIENLVTENLQVEPDIRVPVKYEDYLSGSDTQIEVAVKEMLKSISK